MKFDSIDLFLTSMFTAAVAGIIMHLIGIEAGKDIALREALRLGHAIETDGRGIQFKENVGERALKERAQMERHGL